MKTICISNGHGGINDAGIFDPGAIGEGLIESDLTDDIGGRVVQKLSAYDCSVLLVPRTDSLAARAAYANKMGADLYLSIHVNGGGGTGFESYIWSFDHLDSTMADEYQAIIHGAIMGYLAPLGVANRGMKARNFDELRLTNMPAVLLENLFIDNTWDAAKLRDPAFRAGLANEIAWGCVRALDLKLKAVDPCLNCAMVNELIIERGTLFAENTKLRQVIAQASGVLAGGL